MNIEKIFSVLNQDQMNSSLGIICAELESQGYEVEVEGIQITASEIFENKTPSLEEVNGPLNIKLFKNEKEDQKFSINFIDYHKIIFQEYLK
jgi:hypothetical protein